MNTSSVTAQFGTQMGTPYSASKAAILGITRSLAMELAPWNVRVNAVAPGVVNTEMVSNLNEQERRAARGASPSPARRAPDIANAMLFLASDGLVHNRRTLNVDGGYRPASCRCTETPQAIPERTKTNGWFKDFPNNGALPG